MHVTIKSTSSIHHQLSPHCPHPAEGQDVLCSGQVVVVVLLCLKLVQIVMIRVNTKEDERIAETFPNDPYSNLCILTATQRLNLQQAFLSMDSEYFFRVDPDAREVDLRELPQEPLIRVLHSLYGAQLILGSVGELREVYPIILYLGIEDYKQNVLAEVEQRKEVLESVEFLELSYRYALCWERVKELHMQNRLKLLEDTRNYLQLSKIANETFNVLVMEFWGRFGEAEGKVINNVLENYLNRNSLKPLVYLKANLPKLLPLWLKYHHVSASEMVTLKSTPLIEEETRSRRRTEQLQRRVSEQGVEAKKRRVHELENEVQFKGAMIRELTEQIEEVKRELGITNAQKEITAQSLLINVGGSDTPTPLMRKKKRLAEMSPEIQSDNQGEKEEKRKSVEAKEPKGLMHRLGSKNIKKL